MKRSALDTRTTLLQAALACFAEHGFDGTSIRMIGERAQRPLSLLSHHFGSKEELYLEVFKYIYEYFNNKIEDESEIRVITPPRDKAEAIAILREQIHLLYLDSAKNCHRDDPMHDQAGRLWLQEMRSPRPILYPLIKQLLMPQAELFKKTIQALRPELNDGELNFLVSSLIGQVASHGLMRGCFHLLWGEDEFSGSPFHACELLVNIWVNGLLGAPWSQ